MMKKRKRRNQRGKTVMKGRRKCGCRGEETEKGTVEDWTGRKRWQRGSPGEGRSARKGDAREGGVTERRKE